MQRIAIYEYVTGGGWWETGHWPPPAGLLREGRAMLEGLTADLAVLPQVEVWTTVDSRVPVALPAGVRAYSVGSCQEESALLTEIAKTAAGMILIAPETGGALARRCVLVEAAGGCLLSPDRPFVELTGDKQRTARRLAERHIPVPRGWQFGGPSPPWPLPWPRVIKPIDGCGSQGIRLVHCEAELTPFQNTSSLRCEEFVVGRAASVALLCGPAGCFPLPACEQRLAADGSFAYLGGRLPLPAGYNDRAQALAAAAIAALPPVTGYVGVDLVLGPAADGSQDRVIEVNPRLTTSYVGLRAACATNLAAAMLAVARGERPNLRFHARAVEFSADGTVSIAAAP